MVSREKTGAEKIVEHLKTLQTQKWLAHNKWWPRYLFHFTDITNAVKIFESGALFSRNKAISENLMQCENASPDVISNTKEEYKDYVRLYFRPRTPTQYHNEGFRPLNDRQLGGAHCPIPIIFLFNSEPILTDSETYYSDGNIASPNVKIDNLSEFYLSLNFEDIYHDSSLYGYDLYTRSSINYHKQSEVLIKNELKLDQLSCIFCRSSAEYNTLKNLLSADIWEKWSSKIGVDNKNVFYFNRWPYVTEVELNIHNIIIYLNPIIQGPYKVRVEIINAASNSLHLWEKENYFFDKEIKLSLDKINNLSLYTCKIIIDDHIAYFNSFSEEEIIF